MLVKPEGPGLSIHVLLEEQGAYCIQWNLPATLCSTSALVGAARIPDVSHPQWKPHFQSALYCHTIHCTIFFVSPNLSNFDPLPLHNTN
jgi:hypothetical protein